MIEKILEQLEEEETKWNYIYELDRDRGRRNHYAAGRKRAFTEAIKIVQEVAKEYGNGWIPCSERLPEVQDEYLVWWTAESFKGKCFYEIVEYSPEEGWIGKIPQAPFGKYTVIAWMPLPPKYEPKDAPYQKGE